ASDNIPQPRLYIGLRRYDVGRARALGVQISTTSRLKLRCGCAAGPEDQASESLWPAIEPRGTLNTSGRAHRDDPVCGAGQSSSAVLMNIAVAVNIRDGFHEGRSAHRRR